MFIRHSTPSGGAGFISVEVKYHEDLSGKPASPSPRYDEVARCSRAFPDPLPQVLTRRPLQQIWLDHLLALSMLQADDMYESGVFVFLYPAGNPPCATASDRYRSLLLDPSTFERLTLESVVAAIRWATKSDRIEAVNDRYLDISKLTEV